MGRVSLSADIKHIAVLAVLQVAIVASAIIMILLLCQCYPASSDREDLTAMSEPVTFKQLILLEMQHIFNDIFEILYVKS